MNPRFSIIGFKSDEGVRRNNGRPGAADGPDEIRTHFARMPLHVDAKQVVVADLGDVSVLDGDLETAQERFRGMVCNLHAYHAAHTIGLGGGHEIAYPHMMGLSEAYPHSSIGILNLDAHFDLRPYKEVGSTSGTPFLQIHDQLRAARRPFRYLALGIQHQSNAPALFDTARTLQAGFVTAADIVSSTDWRASLDTFLAESDLVYLSLDMDVFHSHAAPGVSAPNGLGLPVWLVHQIVLRILKSGKVKAFDIAELNPTYDDSARSTARLAASFLHTFIHHT